MIVRRLQADVTVTWIVVAASLAGGFTASTRWFDTARASIASSAEDAALQIAANEKILRTKTHLIQQQRALDERLRGIELDADVATTVARFLGDLDRETQARNLRLVSVTSAGNVSVAARPPVVGTSTETSAQPLPTSPTDPDPFEAIPLDVSVEGRFNDTIALVRSLTTGRTLVKTDLRSIVRASGPRTSVPRLTTTLGVTLYHRAPMRGPAGHPGAFVHA